MIRRGFTLVEVLIAAFIIALGVLGLLALFAGAASQQQSATQFTAAAMLARNAEATVGASFGNLGGEPDDPSLVGKWRPVQMNDRFRYLTVDSDCKRYFLVEPTQPLPLAVYLWQENLATGELVPLYGQAGFVGGNPGQFGSNLRDLGQRRIHPDSVRMQVTVIQDPPGGGEYAVLTRQYYRAQPTYPQDTPQHYVLPRDGQESNASTDFIMLNCQTGCNGTQNASIFAMQIPEAADPERYISRVDLITYKWRADQLVSLGDRTLKRADPTAPGGTRPDLAYSLLYRTTDSGSQMVVYTYQLTPPSSSAQFIPPEREQDYSSSNEYTRPPIRLARLELRYDTVLQQYYVTPEDQEAEWALEPGQVLLVKEVTSPSGPGADAPVRVVRRERRPDEKVRGYLSDSPRAGNTSLLPPERRTGNGFVALEAYGVNDVVTSLADDSRWKLKSLEAFVFQVSN